ncbi:MAG: MmcQ/YjbR family DNA-binding protein [Armatimonadetes bacterium]|nr:MmcQ/YjbR family DNA-binding protein [Armatimonadota bacterium]
MTVKLPSSNEFAIALADVQPAGYGMGKNGWVTILKPAVDEIPIEMLQDWITESYRAVAPKRLSALLVGAAK